MSNSKERVIDRFVRGNTALLLWVANSFRHERTSLFYDVKDYILKHFGARIGFDLQVIPEKGCYSCGGSGIYYLDRFVGCLSVPVTCRNCCGTGIYKTKQFVVLERFLYGGDVYHLPVRNITEGEIGDYNFLNKIEGLVPKVNLRGCHCATELLCYVYGDNEVLIRQLPIKDLVDFMHQIEVLYLLKPPRRKREVNKKGPELFQEDEKDLPF